MDHDQPTLHRSFILLLFLPCVGYLILIQLYAYNFPFLDDYVTVLGHALLPALEQVHNWFLPHNEHIHLILKVAVSLDLWIFGEVNLIRLQWLGAIFLLIFFSVLLRSQRHQHLPWVWMIPVSFLLFQPSYWGNMTWTTTSLHNFPGLLFALLTLSLWNSATTRKQFLALGFLILALASNGYGLAVVGILILWETWILCKHQTGHWHQRKAQLVGFVLTLAAAALYWIALGELNLRANIDGNTPIEYVHFLSNFLGSCFHFLGAPWLNLLSVLLIASFVWSWKQGLWKINPTLFLFSGYLILSALVTTIARTDLGPDQGLASRYRIYSTLLVCSSYLSLAQVSWKSWMRSRWRFPLLLTLSILFYTLSLLVNINNLNKIKLRLIADEQRWSSGKDIQEFLNPKDARLYLDAADQAGVFPKQHR